MIDAKELRIGNFFRDKLTGAMLSVCDLKKDPDEIGKGTTGFYVVDRSLFPLPKGWQAEPIPLSPEILERCGFEFDDFPCEKWFSNDIGFIEKCDGGYTLPDSDGEPSIGYVLKYLHQLQNLYYCLVGEELVIESPVSKI